METLGNRNIKRKKIQPQINKTTETNNLRLQVLIQVIYARLTLFLFPFYSRKIFVEAVNYIQNTINISDEILNNIRYEGNSRIFSEDRIF